MWDIKLHNFLSGQSRHVKAKLISNQLDKTVKFFPIIITFILLYFDKFNRQLREDNLANIEVNLWIDEGIFILKVSKITCVLADCVKHAHQLFDELLSLELFGHCLGVVFV